MWHRLIFSGKAWYTVSWRGKIVDFHAPSQECDHIDRFRIRGISAIMRYTVGSVQDTSHLVARAGLKSLERELHSRLSFPWLFDHPVDRQTLVLVGGCPNLQSDIPSRK
jgi:hypothetical protein